MKKCVLLTAILFLCSKILLAQLSYNYTLYSIGAGGGSARAFADVPKEITKASFFVNFNYSYSPYVTFSAELQAGKLAGGDTKTDQHTRAFENSYKAAYLYADFQAGEFIDYQNRKFLNFIKNFYVGTGLGLVHNSMTFVQRNSLNDPSYVFPGVDASTELAVPFRTGYEIKFFNFYEEPSVKVNLGYEMNWVYGEGLDGYADPPSIFKNNHVDRYAQIFVCVKYSFGNPISYKKPIRGFY